MDEKSFMIDWVDSVWRKRPRTSLYRHAILVLDSFRCPIINKIKEKLAVCHTDIVVIPCGRTSQIQPIYVHLNELIKDHIQRPAR